MKTLSAGSLEAAKNPFNITRYRMQAAFDALKRAGEAPDPNLRDRVMNMDVTAERKFSVDGVGVVTGMRCHHLEVPGLVSKGGNRFDPELTPDKDRALAFSQTPKNLMAGLPYTGSKGGANIDSKMAAEKVMAVSQRWVDTFMDMIGPNFDVPAGDWGVGSREVDWMVERYRDNLMKIAKVASEGGAVVLSKYKAKKQDLIERDYEVKFNQGRALEYFVKNVGLDQSEVCAGSEVLARIAKDNEFAMLFARPCFTGKTAEMGGHPVRTGATGRGMFVQSLEGAKYRYVAGEWRPGENIRLSGEQDAFLRAYVSLHLGQGSAGERAAWQAQVSGNKQDMRDIEQALFKDATLVVTGAGKVGLGIIDEFQKLDCGVRLLAMSDSRGAIKTTDGSIDISRITAIKNSGGSVTDYGNGVAATNQRDILSIPCTILASTTPEFAYIDETTAPTIQAQMHLQGTNGPSTPAADRILREKGVFDLDDILNNAGGVTASGLEWARNLHAVAEYINPTLRKDIDSLGLVVDGGQVRDESMYSALDGLMVKDFWTTLRTAVQYNTGLGTANRINTIHRLQSVITD